MKTLDTSTLARDASVVTKVFSKKGKSIIAAKDCSIIVPNRYFNTELGIMGDDVKILNCYALYDRDRRYCVINSNNSITVTPTEVFSININGEDYKELAFDVGDIVIPNTEVVKTESIIYNILNEFIMLGNVPWFMEYEDMGNLFSTAVSHASSKAASNVIVMHALISIISRYYKNRSIYYRMVADKEKQPVFLPFSNIWYSYNNTTSRIVGAYMKQGITASLVEESDTLTRTERLIRS